MLGVLIVGEVFKALQDIYIEGVKPQAQTETQASRTGNNKLGFPLIKSISPTIARSAVIGTVIGLSLIHI